MTLKAYLIWFKDNWQKTGVIVALFLIIYLSVIVLPQNTLLFALLMCLPLYMLHETEEYVFPGGFAQFVNHNIYKADPETGPVNKSAVFWINMVGVWSILGFFSLAAAFDITQATTIPYFFIFQALLHLIIGIIGRRVLNPGMITAWLIHVPWGVWTIGLLVRAGVISNPYWNGDLILGFLLNFALLPIGLMLVFRYKRKKALVQP